MEGLIFQFKYILEIRLEKSHLNCGCHRENTDVQHLQNNVSVLRHRLFLAKYPKSAHFHCFQHIHTSYQIRICNHSLQVLAWHQCLVGSLIERLFANRCNWFSNVHHPVLFSIYLPQLSLCS